MQKDCVDLVIEEVERNLLIHVCQTVILVDLITLKDCVVFATTVGIKEIMPEKRIVIPIDPIAQKVYVICVITQNGNKTIFKRDWPLLFVIEYPKFLKVKLDLDQRLRILAVRLSSS